MAHIYEVHGVKGTSYKAEVHLGTDENGKRIRPTKTFKGKREAQKWVSEITVAHSKGELLSNKSKKLTFCGYFQNEWIPYKRDASDDTKKMYMSYFKNHIQPFFKNTLLEKVTALQIQQLIVTLEEKELSESMVRRVYTVISTCLNTAVKLDLIHKNPAKQVDAPKVSKREMKVWDVATIQRFLKVTRGQSRHWIAFYLAITSGMRQGEILGLRWKDVDFENKVIRITQTLSHDGKELRAGAKTAKSVRAISITDADIKELRAHHAFVLQEKLRLGSKYVDLDLVVPTSKGTPAGGRAIDKVHHRWLIKFKFPRIKYHDLRHCSASLLFLMNVHPKIVSERLGHSTVATTMEIYSHLMPGMQQEAADKLSKILFNKE